MARHEILVHITAPSTFLDDKQYEAQAAAIAAFEPVTRLQIYRAGDFDAGALTAEGHSSQPLPMVALEGDAQIDQSTTKQGPTGGVQSSSDYVTPSEKIAHRSDDTDRLPTDSPGNERVPGLPELLPTNILYCGMVNNPPYRNPFGPRQTKLSDIQAERTPDQPRPKTAPAGDLSHAIPAVRPHKRSYSESSSFETLSSVVPETDASFRVSESSPEEQKRKRQRLEAPGADQNLEWQGSTRLSPSASHVSSSLPQAPYPHPPVLAAVAAPQRSQVEPRHTCFFPQNRDYDYDSSRGESSSSQDKSNLSTESPSQSWHRSAVQHLETASTVREHIDLTTPLQSKSSSEKERLAMASIQSRSSGSSGSLPKQAKKQKFSPDATVFPRISVLPEKIFPAPPETGNGSPKSHVTDSLQRLTDLLTFEKRFRPVLVSREVSSSERGYWHLPITVAPDDVVALRRASIQAIRRARSQRVTLRETATKLAADEGEQLNPETIAMKERHVGPRKRPEDDPELNRLADTVEKGNLWTEDEFLAFWNNLEEKFTSYYVGWGCRIFRETPPPPPPSLNASTLTSVPGPGTMTTHLKITTWAEVIPHIWLTLWVLSDRRTAETEMEWRAGDEDVIVKMGKGMRVLDREKGLVRGEVWGRKSEGQEREGSGSGGSERWGLVEGMVHAIKDI